MGNGELWPPTESKSLGLNRLRKIVTVDYVRETNRYANLAANPSTGASGQMVKYNVKLFLHTYTFSGEQPTCQTVRPILTRDQWRSQGGQ